MKLKSKQVVDSLSEVLVIDWFLCPINTAVSRLLGHGRGVIIAGKR